MSLPRKSRRLQVDGEEYRWLVSRNVLRVEHTGCPGRLATEVLGPGEAVGPGRVAAMIRHARQRGWRPSEGSAGYQVWDASPLADPRGRDEYVWVRSLQRVLGWFEAYVGTPVELGHYWWEGERHASYTSLCARLRWGRSDVLPGADHVEATLSISGSRGETIDISVSAFPFQGGRVVLGEESSDFLFVLRQAEGGAFFEARGWSSWHDAEEWAYVQAPGDLFLMIPGFAEERWATVALAAESVPDEVDVHLHSVSSETRGPLVAARGRPWLRDAGVRVKREGTSLRLDVTRLALPGGWTPGSYQVALRISGLGYGDGQESQITEPLPMWIAAGQVAFPSAVAEDDR